MRSAVEMRQLLRKLKTRYAWTFFTGTSTQAKHR